MSDYTTNSTVNLSINGKDVEEKLDKYQKKLVELRQKAQKAAEIGAVNTVVNRSGKLFGYNTDFGGLKALFQRVGINVSGKKAIIFGNGGTSKTAEAVLKKLGAQTVLKTDIVPAENVITNEEAVLKHSDAEILVNTTPCGMFPKARLSPVWLPLPPVSSTWAIWSRAPFPSA